VSNPDNQQYGKRESHAVCDTHIPDCPPNTLYTDFAHRYTGPVWRWWEESLAKLVLLALGGAWSSLCVDLTVAEIAAIVGSTPESINAVKKFLASHNATEFKLAATRDILRVTMPCVDAEVGGCGFPFIWLLSLPRCLSRIYLHRADPHYTPHHTRQHTYHPHRRSRSGRRYTVSSTPALERLCFARA
jgi:hypothetical protein